MLPGKTKFFILISFTALLAVLLIQINWIFQTAKIREDLFNEKANMVLSRTTESIRKDKETCMKIGACVELDSSGGQIAKLGKDEIQTIDSLFNYYMNFYNFHINYKYEVVKPGLNNANYNFSNYIYNKPLEQISDDQEVELKLIFPDKRQFIRAELGGLFIASIILIIIVLLMFYRTVMSLLQEKKVADQTNEFLNNMTHEFKTPLTNINLAVRLIQKDKELNDGQKLRHYSGIILEESERLNNQVESVLSMTALERGEMPWKRTETDLHELLKEVADNIRLQVENKNGHIHLELVAENFKVEGDKTLLLAAFRNLLDNAIKYSGEIPVVDIQTKNDDGKIVIAIADWGIGIDKEYQEKIFDKYFRVPAGDIHNVKGFGLGLAYVRKIIMLHEGNIGLKSEKGKGSVFIITLPYA